MGWAGNNSDATCPYINGEDHRCGKRLSLGQIDQAFAYCMGGYLACPTYHQLSWEQQPLEVVAPQTDPAAEGTPGHPPRRFALIGQAGAGPAATGTDAGAEKHTVGPGRKRRVG